MDCERVQDLLSDYLDGSLPESELQGVAAHLRDCRQCLAAAEGLKETLALLRNLPAEKAPPELLEGVRRRIAREGSGKPLWKKLFLPAHVKIPIEAAAAVLLFLLVYGSQKQEAPKTILLPPAARVETPGPVFQGGQKAEGKGEGSVRARSEPVPPERLRKPEAAGAGFAVRGGSVEPSGREAEAASRNNALRVARVPRAGDAAGQPPPGVSPLSARPQAQSSLPVVPAQMVSTAGERIEPGGRREKQAEEPAALPRLFAAPPSRLMRPLPYGREVTLEVSTDSRAGLEDRIAAAAMRLGGSAHREAARGGASAEGAAADAVRVQVPRASAEPFLAELRKLGTVPPEGSPGWADFPAGPSAEVVVYTVRILIR